jgi:hypothetical protein
MLYARETKATRENFAARCPACTAWVTFNRASDLDGQDKISFRKVTCPECHHQFAINGDNASPTYAVLLHDVFDLMQQQEYARAILNIAQSYEAFFLHSLRELLALKLLIKDRRTNELDAVNRTLREIHVTTEGWAYRRMRNAFISLALNGKPSTTVEAQAFVQRLPALKDDPTDRMITAHHDGTLATLLLRLKQSRIDEVRNDVAHKHAHRPTAAQAAELFDEARDLIGALAVHLDVHYDSC